MTVRIEAQAVGMLHAGNVLGKLSTLDMTDLLDNVGAMVESQVRRRIQHEKRSPDGVDWEPWSERYARTRSANHSLLQNRGHLLDSITYNIVGDSVEVGTNLVYGATHQMGDRRRNIPARPYLGVSHEDEDDIEDLVNQWIEREVGI